MLGRETMSRCKAPGASRANVLPTLNLGGAGAKCFLESSVDLLFFELFHIKNARCGVEHNFRGTCKNLQNLGNFGVPLAASLSYSICNGFFELQACEKRKKKFARPCCVHSLKHCRGAAGVCATRSTELTVFTMIPRGINAFGRQFRVVA